MGKHYLTNAKKQVEWEDLPGYTHINSQR
jgi:hypothetical protein